MKQRTAAIGGITSAIALSWIIAFIMSLFTTMTWQGAGIFLTLIIVFVVNAIFWINKHIEGEL